MKTLMIFEGDPSEPRWVAVNDGVMGGESLGSAVLAETGLHFSGSLSLANNGGFASVRAREHSFDFSDVTNLVLRVRGDGRDYQLRLATDARFRGIPISYGAEFPTVDGEWSVVRIALQALTPTARGTALDGPPLDSAHIREIGLLIGDKKPGEFSLTVDWIAVE